MDPGYHRAPARHRSSLRTDSPPPVESDVSVQFANGVPSDTQAEIKKVARQIADRASGLDPRAVADNIASDPRISERSSLIDKLIVSSVDEASKELVVSTFDISNGKSILYKKETRFVNTRDSTPPPAKPSDVPGAKGTDESGEPEQTKPTNFPDIDLSKTLDGALARLRSSLRKDSVESDVSVQFTNGVSPDTQAEIKGVARQIANRDSGLDPRTVADNIASDPRISERSSLIDKLTVSSVDKASKELVVSTFDISNGKSILYKTEKRFVNTRDSTPPPAKPSDVPGAKGTDESGEPEQTIDLSKTLDVAPTKELQWETYEYNKNLKPRLIQKERALAAEQDELEERKRVLQDAQVLYDDRIRKSDENRALLDSKISQIEDIYKNLQATLNTQTQSYLNRCAEMDQSVKKLRESNAREIDRADALKLANEQLEEALIAMTSQKNEELSSTTDALIEEKKGRREEQKALQQLRDELVEKTRELDRLSDIGTQYGDAKVQLEAIQTHNERLQKSNDIAEERLKAALQLIDRTRGINRQNRAANLVHQKVRQRLKAKLGREINRADTLRGELEEKTQELDRLGDIGTKYGDVKARLETIQTHHDSLRDELELKTQELEAQRAEFARLEDVETQKTDLAKKLVDRDASKRILDEENAALLTALEERQRALNERDAQLGTLRAQYDEDIQTMAGAKDDELNLSQAKLNMAQAELSELEKELSELEKELSTEKSITQGAREELSKQQNRVKAKNTELKQRGQALTAQRRERSKIKAEQAVLEERLANRARELEELRLSRSTLDDQKAALETTLRERSEQNEALEASLVDRDRELGELRDTRIALGDQKAALEATLRERSEQNEALEATVKETEEQLKVVNNQLSAKDKKLHKAKRQLQRAQADEEDLVKLRRNIGKEVEARKELLVEKSKLESEKDKLLVERSILESEKDNLGASLTALQAFTASKFMENVNLAKTIDRLQQQIQELQARVPDPGAEERAQRVQDLEDRLSRSDRSLSTVRRSLQSITSEGEFVDPRTLDQETSPIASEEESVNQATLDQETSHPSSPIAGGSRRHRVGPQDYLRILDRLSRAKNKHELRSALPGAKSQFQTLRSLRAMHA